LPRFALAQFARLHQRALLQHVAHGAPALDQHEAVRLLHQQADEGNGRTQAQVAGEVVVPVAFLVLDDGERAERPVAVFQRGRGIAAGAAGGGAVAAIARVRAGQHEQAGDGSDETDLHDGSSLMVVGARPMRSGSVPGHATRKTSRKECESWKRSLPSQDVHVPSALHPARTG
jgi:hypothetical protein